MSELRSASHYLRTCPFIFETNGGFHDVDILALLSTESTPEEWSCLGSLLWDVGLLRGVEPTCRLITDTARRLSKSSQAMRERLQKVKKGLLHRAQATLTHVIAKEKELVQHGMHSTVGTDNHALGATSFVSYLFIYGLIPSKFVFVIGEQLLDLSTDLTSTMMAVFLTTDKFMVLHDTVEWSQFQKFDRLLDRVQDLADDESLSPVSRKAMQSILASRERAAQERYLAEGFYSDMEESDTEPDVDDDLENKDPMCIGSRKSSCKIDSVSTMCPSDKTDFVNSVPLAKWSATDVSNFLVQNHLEMYVDVFVSQRIDGDICYHDLSVEMLKELGVEAWHRGKLCRLFQNLS
jgi:2-hydroxy-3-keto-5-methylthiopentenyl-1-phosphate phosphatase